jgi:hypothetical protein
MHLCDDWIAMRAYEIWEMQGRPYNRDLDHWLRAEREFYTIYGMSLQS